MKTAQPKDIDEYIAGVPQNVQEILQKIRGIVRKAAPDAEEAIKYQIPTFVLHEPTAAALGVFDVCGRFAAPWLRRGVVPGGCGSVLR